MKLVDVVEGRLVVVLEKVLSLLGLWFILSGPAKLIDDGVYHDVPFAKFEVVMNGVLRSASRAFHDDLEPVIVRTDLVQGLCVVRSKFHAWVVEL